MQLILSRDDQHACADGNVDSWFDQVKGWDYVPIATAVQLARIETAVALGELEDVTLQVGSRVFQVPAEECDYIEYLPEMQMFVELFERRNRVEIF